MSGRVAALEPLQSALKSGNLAPSLSAALDGAQAAQVISILSLSLLGTQDASLEELALEVPKQGNVAKMHAADAYWKTYSASKVVENKGNSPPPSQAPINTTTDRLQQAAAQNNTAIYLAYITTIGFFLLIFCLIALDHWTSPTADASGHYAAPPPSPYKDILLTLMGIVGTGWAGIISFFFGSSVGARQQSQTLQDISRGKQTEGITSAPPSGK